MKPHDERYWSWLDGEMSPAEAAAFRDSLSEADQDRMDADLRLETALGQSLGAPVACPAEAWQKALDQINEAKNARKPKRSRFLRQAYWAIPLAAMLLVALAMTFKGDGSIQPKFLDLINDDDIALAEHGKVSGNVSLVRAFMEQRKLPVSLNSEDMLDGHSAPYRLIGAQEVRFSGEPVVRLLFDCDNHPAMLVIASQGGFAAREIGKALAKGSIRASRSFDAVIVALVGRDAPFELVGALNGARKEPAAIAADTTPEAAPADGAVSTDGTSSVEMPQAEPVTPAPETTVEVATPPADTLVPQPSHAALTETTPAAPTQDQPQEQPPAPEQPETTAPTVGPAI